MGCGMSNSVREDNVSLDFLILFKQDDYQKTFKCMSKMHKIKNDVKKLPGNVNIEKLSETSKEIKGLKIPYVVYLKLPKERIYVTSDTWEFEYFNSQVMELIGIFTALGASEIIFNATKMNEDDQSFEASIGAKVTNVAVSIEASREIKHNEHSKFSGHIKINNVAKVRCKTVKEFISQNMLYYANFYPEWKSLIGYKLTTDTSQIDFEYTFHKGFHCQTKVGAKLENAGIICGFTNTNVKDITLKFCVTFAHPGSQLIQVDGFSTKCMQTIEEESKN
jgi:hypothetical protein